MKWLLLTLPLLLISCVSAYTSQLALLDQLHTEGKLSDAEWTVKRQELVTMEEGRRTRSAIAFQGSMASLQATGNQMQTNAQLSRIEINQQVQNMQMQNAASQQRWNSINTFQPTPVYHPSTYYVPYHSY